MMASSATNGIQRSMTVRGVVPLVLLGLPLVLSACVEDHDDVAERGLAEVVQFEDSPFVQMLDSEHWSDASELDAAPAYRVSNSPVLFGGLEVVDTKFTRRYQLVSPPEEAMDDVEAQLVALGATKVFVDDVPAADRRDVDRYLLAYVTDDHKLKISLKVDDRYSAVSRPIGKDLVVEVAVDKRYGSEGR